MDVPDDWAVAYTAFGLELKSPEKNLYIVADILPRKKDEADAWAKKATQKMEAFGVTFGAPKPPEMAKVAPPATKVPPLAPGGVGPASEPPKVEASKVEPAKPEVTKPEMTKPEATKAEPAKPEPPVASGSPKPEAVAKAETKAAAPVGASPAAPVPAPMPSMIETTKPTQATAEPPKAEPSKGEPVKSDPTKPDSVAAAPPPPSPIAVDRAAPSFTFMNPPVPINPPASSAPDTVDRVPVFSGPPSIETPERSKAETALKSDIPEGSSLEQLTRTTPKLPKLPFKVGRFPAATWNGQPVDVQIVNFGLSPKQLFLVVQASLSSDDRAVAIITSAHPVK